VTRDSTFNVISSEIPPLPGDHIAASREALAAMPVRTTTMIPETTEAMARPISLLTERPGDITVWQAVYFLIPDA
jgi:hypothetical protein